MRFIRLYLKAYAGMSQQAWMLALVLLINRSGSMVLPFLSVYLKDELEFSLQDVGIILSLFGLGSLLGSMLGGFLTDKIGSFWVQFGSLIFGGIGFILLRNVQTFEGLAAGFFLVTIITDALRPANATAVAEYAKKENITRAYSLNRMAVNLGFAIGPLVGGTLAAMSYELLFYVDGFTCIAAGIVFAIYFSRVKPRNKPVAEQPVVDAEVLRVNSPFRDVPYLGFVFLTAGFGVIFFQIFSTLPIYYRDIYQLSEIKIGWLIGLNGFIVFLIEMPLVYALGDKFSLRRIVAIGVVLSGLAYLLLNMATGWAILLFSMFVLSLSEILVMPYLTTYTATRAHVSVRGKYMGLYGMAYSLAFILAPALGLLLIAQQGFPTLWYAAFGLAIVVAAGFLWNMKEVKVKPEISKIIESGEARLNADQVTDTADSERE